MTTPAPRFPLLQLYQAAIDPAWLHVPEYAAIRDLPRPPLGKKAF